MKKYTLLTILIMILLISIISIQAQVIDNPLIEITLVEQDPDPVAPGDYTDLRFSIKNTGKNTAKNVEIRAEVSYPFSAYEEDPQDYISLGDIDIYDSTAEETNEVSKTVRVRVDKDAVAGAYTFTPQFRVYNVPSNVFWQNADHFNIEVESEKTILTITDFHTVPERIAPGQQGTLFITFENQGAQYLEDIKIKCDFSSVSEFFPVLTSNEQTVSILDAGEEVTVSFTLLADASADLKGYKLPVNVTYLDDSGDSDTIDNYISILVDTLPEYVLNIEETTVYKAKQPGKVVVSLSNIGASDINYATLSLLENEAYELISTNTAYLGNLESDDFETAEYEIYVTEYQDELPLQLNLQYKDNFNNNYDETLALNLNLFTSREAKKYGLVSGSSYTTIFFILLVIAAGVGYWYYRKKKKAKETKTKKSK